MLYRCRSFHLVTIDEHLFDKVAACQLSTMSDGEFKMFIMSQIDDILNSAQFKEKLETLITNH